MTTMQQRKHTVSLSGNLPAQNSSAIIDALNSHEAVHNVSLNEGKLTIQYSFPATAFSDILLTIDHHLNPALPRLMNRFRHAFIAWIEDNERDHLYLHDGWDKYARDIHVAHSRPGFPAMTQIKKQWQQYRNPDKPGNN